MKDGRKYNRMSVLAMMGFFCFFFIGHFVLYNLSRCKGVSYQSCISR